MLSWKSDLAMHMWNVDYMSILISIREAHTMAMMLMDYAKTIRSKPVTEEDLTPLKALIKDEYDDVWRRLGYLSIDRVVDSDRLEVIKDLQYVGDMLTRWYDMIVELMNNKRYYYMNRFVYDSLDKIKAKIAWASNEVRTLYENTYADMYFKR